MTTSSIRANIAIFANTKSPKILYTTMFVGLLILSTGFILFVASLHLFTKKTVATSIANASSGDVPVLVPPTRDLASGLNIANNGLVFLRNAKVASISSDKKIHVVISWGKTNFAWVVETGTFTKFFDVKGGKTSFTEIHIGDVVTVTGKLSGDGAEPLISAEFIRIV